MAERHEGKVWNDQSRIRDMLVECFPELGGDYSERGARNAEQVYSSESAACDELMQRAHGDGAVQRWMAEHRAWAYSTAVAQR